MYVGGIGGAPQAHPGLADMPYTVCEHLHLYSADCTATVARACLDKGLISR